MKPQHFAIVTGVLLVAAVALIAGKPQQTASTQAQAAAPVRTITVIGEAEVQAKPDQALVTIGIWTGGASASDAEALNRAFVKQVEAAMVAAGADSDQFEATKDGLSATTQQDYSGTSHIAGYESRTTVRALVRNLSKSQAVVDAALAAGATSLQGVSYRLENPEQAKQTAAKQALDSAKARATALLKSQGEKIGDLTAIEVLPTDSPPNVLTSPAGMLFKAQVKATFTY
ncbi:MAG: SIMPL domain-containing protein [Mycobacterium leprae]